MCWEHWAPFLFQYILGGIFFALSLMITFCSGDMKIQPKENKKFLYILVAGFALYASGHALWIFLASYT